MASCPHPEPENEDPDEAFCESAGITPSIHGVRELICNRCVACCLPPILCKEILSFQQVMARLRSKIFRPLGLPAECSSQMTYEIFKATPCVFLADHSGHSLIVRRRHEINCKTGAGIEP